MPLSLLEQFSELEFATRAALAGREGKHFAVGGLVGSSSALLLASLDKTTPALRLVVAAGPDEAALLRQDLAFFLGGDAGVRFFPAFDSVKPESRARETGRVADRTSAIENLGAGDDRTRFLVAPIAALLQPVPSPAQVARSRVSFRVGERLDFDALAARLTEAGFARMPMVEGPGEWSRR